MIKALKDKATIVGTILLDTGLTVIWVVILYAANRYIINELYVPGVDAWVIKVAKALVAVFPLTALLIFMYKDLRIIWIKAMREIREQQDK